MKRLTPYIVLVILVLLMTISPLVAVETSVDDGPMIGTKSSITALKISMNYLERRSGEKFMPYILPMPLMDPAYYDYGEWAFYVDQYFNELLKPALNGHGDRVNIKPLDLSSRQQPSISRQIDTDKALVRVDYPDHKELERLLQKLYFNLIRGPVVLTVAYDPKNVPEEYSRYSNWNCFDALSIQSSKDIGDAHLVYVDWSQVHTVVAFLDGGQIRVADHGIIYNVDHNALVAQANAIKAMPGAGFITDNGDQLNFLVYYQEKQTHVAWNKKKKADVAR